MANTVLLAAGAVSFARDASFEVLIGASQHRCEIRRPRPDRVLGLVPALLRVKQRLVVGVAGLVDSLLDADIAGDAIPLREKFVGCDQARQASVAVCHRMDREQVEDQRRDQDQRMAGVRGLRVVIALEQLAQQERRLRWSRWREHDLAAPALVRHDEVLVGLQVSPASAGMLEQQPMKVQYERHGRRLIAIESYQRVDRIAVPGELLFVSIAKARRPFGDLQGALAADGHPLNRVGSRDRRDSRVLREPLQ